MSTKLPKISAYIPKELHDCLVKDKKKTGLSMSQVIIAALANHYGLEETIGRGGRRVVVGGETSERINALENQVSNLKESIESQFADFSQVLSRISPAKESSNNSGSNSSAQSTKPQAKSKKNGLKEENKEFDASANLNLFPDAESKEQSEPKSNIELSLNGYSLSQRRFGLSKNAVSGRKKNSTEEEFAKWSLTKDPDGISWTYDKEVKLYKPVDNLPDEKYQKLSRWIIENNQSKS